MEDDEIFRLFLFNLSILSILNYIIITGLITMFKKEMAIFTTNFNNTKGRLFLENEDGKIDRSFKEIETE